MSHSLQTSVALAAFQELFARSSGQGQVFANMQGGAAEGLQALVWPCTSRGWHQLFYLVLLATYGREPIGDGRLLIFAR